MFHVSLYTGSTFYVFAFFGSDRAWAESFAADLRRYGACAFAHVGYDG